MFFPGGQFREFQENLGNFHAVERIVALLKGRSTLSSYLTCSLYWAELYFNYSQKVV